jgi:hypothetical protein
VASGSTMRNALKKNGRDESLGRDLRFERLHQRGRAGQVGPGRDQDVRAAVEVDDGDFFVDVVAGVGLAG